jgi:hypothetical protein
VENVIELGDLAKDRITGFEGVVYGITTWLNGCQRITLAPRALGEHGRLPSTETFDIEQVELVKKAVVTTAKGQRAEVARRKESGGPMPNVPQR